MPMNRKLRGPALKGSAMHLSNTMEGFLITGFDMDREGEDDRREEVRAAWESNKEKICRVAEEWYGRGMKPWAHFALDLNDPEGFDQQQSDRAMHGAREAQREPK